MPTRYATVGRLFAAASLVLLAAGIPAFGQTVSFKDDVFPIIQLRCLECHQPGGKGYETSGLDMRTYESLMKGTKFGSMITPNSPLESSLMAVIEHRTSPRIAMPHNRKRLSPCEIQMFRFWIAQGAKNN